MACSRFPLWLIAVLLVLVTIALYWPATGHDFVNYDDKAYVLDNPHVISGLTLGNARWALGSGYAGNWHPVTWLSHMLDCQMFGLNAWGHHLTSVVLHALNVVLVFALLHQMTGAVWRCLFVAALFAVHPLRVESVAWVAERKDVLSGCFGLLALIFYARWAGRSVISNQWPVTSGQASGPNTTNKATRHTPHATVSYLLSLGCFALGLMSKPMLVTWPCVMLLLDYWPLRRMPKAEPRSTLHAPRFTLHALLPWLTEKLPFFALAAVASVVTFLVQQQEGAVKSVQHLSLGARSGNALVSYCRYLGKLFWPTNLTVFYPHPGQWSMAKVLLAGGLILGISALLLVKRSRSPYLLVGWLWFIGTLVPVIGLVQVGDQAMADRYTYIPSLGVLVLVIWGGYELTRRWRYATMALSAGAAAAIALGFGLTRHQLGYWQESETLFRHALEVTENNHIAHDCLGVALFEKGQIDAAISQYLEAIRLEPNDSLAHDNLGIALVRKDLIDEAIRQLQESLRLKPADAPVRFHLGNAFAKKGQLYEAIGQFQESLRLQPDDPTVHNNLGNALAKKGQTDEAIRQLQEALRLKPAQADVHYNLGNALVKRGQIDEAILQFQEASHLRPEDADTHNNLGVLLCRKGRPDEAGRQFQEALRLRPDYADARRNLNAVLAIKPGSLPRPTAATNP